MAVRPLQVDVHPTTGGDQQTVIVLLVGLQNDARVVARTLASHLCQLGDLVVVRYGHGSCDVETIYAELHGPEGVLTRNPQWRRVVTLGGSFGGLLAALLAARRLSAKTTDDRDYLLVIDDSPGSGRSVKLPPWLVEAGRWARHCQPYEAVDQLLTTLKAAPTMLLLAACGNRPEAHIGLTALWRYYAAVGLYPVGSLGHQLDTLLTNSVTALGQPGWLAAAYRQAYFLTGPNPAGDPFVNTALAIEEWRQAHPGLQLLVDADRGSHGHNPFGERPAGLAELLAKVLANA